MNESKKLKISFRTLKMFIFCCVDIAIIFASYILGYIIEKNVIDGTTILFILSVTILHILIFSLFGGYKIVTDEFSLTDAIRFSVLIMGENIIAALANHFVPNVTSLNVLIFAFILTFQIILIVASRTVQRAVRFYTINSKNNITTIVIGSGSCAAIAYNEAHKNVEFNNHIVCFVDDDKQKIGKKYFGLPIYGPIENIHQYIEKYSAKEVIIAISNIDKVGLKRIINILKNEDVKVKRMPILSEQQDPTKPELMKIKEVSLAELLGREQITFDTKQIADWLKDKRVLLTGAGGSIGSELARQLYTFGVKQLVMFDIYENAIYNIQMELTRKIKADNSSMELITLIGSTYNEFRVEELFEKYRPEVVFHAAAYKHVPLMEDSPVEAIRTNCLGTWNVAKMADKYNVEKMVLVSTDKAVRPTNTMGATKAFAEMIIRYWNEQSIVTKYSAVRFGNVLGSNGSVIPLFKDQIKEGGPVTVTHPDIIRFFMTIPEAVSLILQSGAFADGGEIFILDMGQPVKIVTLAENVIKQCGYRPYKDIDIVFTGLRPGEKLFEELLLDVTKNKKTSNSKIYIEEPHKILPMDEKIEYISKVFNMTNNDEIKDCLRKVVTSYTNYEEFNAKVVEARSK